MVGSTSELAAAPRNLLINPDRNLYFGQLRHLLFALLESVSADNLLKMPEHPKMRACFVLYLEPFGAAAAIDVSSVGYSSLEFSRFSTGDRLPDARWITRQGCARPARQHPAQQRPARSRGHEAARPRQRPARREAAGAI